MASDGLTEAWRGAESAKPSTWTIRGVVLGPREVDPRVGSAVGGVGGRAERRAAPG